MRLAKRYVYIVYFTKFFVPSLCLQRAAAKEQTQ